MAVNLRLRAATFVRQSCSAILRIRVCLVSCGRRRRLVDMPQGPDPPDDDLRLRQGQAAVVRAYSRFANSE